MLIRIFLFLVLVVFVLVPSNAFEGFGPAVRATKGEPWPKPQRHVKKHGFYTVNSILFQFNVTNYRCTTLSEALTRYKKFLVTENGLRRQVQHRMRTRRFDFGIDPHFHGTLESVSVKLMAPCEEWPYLNMDEQYEIRIEGRNTTGEPAIITSQTIWGILRGLETFIQLITSDDLHTALIINCTAILDFPRFSHRGLLIDTSRHFIPVSNLLQMLDGMEANKMNVLHWHIVDDQSFPYKSRKFPELSQRGAYNPVTHVYKLKDIKNVIEYARMRGIRVIPEFDTPGHTRSWGEAFPYLLTKCNDGTLGPMDPTNSTVYDFLKDLFEEVKVVFPDTFFHIGGDEVPFGCWEGNPKVKQFMIKNKMTAPDLEQYFIQKVINIVSHLTKKPIVWQEVYDNDFHHHLSRNVIVHVWKGGFPQELSEITYNGYYALLSSCWYLDHLQSGGDWDSFYRCEPTRFPGNDEQKKKVLGGEACMWSEVVDVINLSSRIWPRASAAAEKLWSSYNTTDVRNAARRLEEHSCRMNRRGIPTQPPNGPGFCPFTNY